MSSDGANLPPNPIPPSISTASPKRARAARWATSPGSIPRAESDPIWTRHGPSVRAPADAGPRSVSGRGLIWPPASNPDNHPGQAEREKLVQVVVRDNNVDQALRAL